MTVTPIEPRRKRRFRPFDGEDAHCEHAVFDIDTPECPAGEDWRAFLWPCAQHPEGCDGHGFCHAHMAALLLDRVHRGLVAAIQRVQREL